MQSCPSLSRAWVTRPPLLNGHGNASEDTNIPKRPFSKAKKRTYPASKLGSERPESRGTGWLVQGVEEVDEGATEGDKEGGRQAPENSNGQVNGR